MEKLQNCQLNSSEKKIITKFETERSMQARLILWLQLYPFSISGLKLENLINDQKKKFQGLLEPSLKKKMNNLKNVPTPREIKIDRSILNKISEHTGVSRRSLERGISSFFARKFFLLNISPYSRKYLIFGRNSQTDPKKNKNKNKSKTNLKKKEKMVKTIHNKNYNNTQAETKKNKKQKDYKKQNQKKKQKEKQKEKQNQKKKQKEKQKDNEKEKEKEKENKKEKEQITQLIHQKQKIYQRREEETLLIDFIRQKRSYSATNNISNKLITQNNPNQQTRKTPLQILCEVSQHYKRMRVNPQQYDLWKKKSLYSKKN
ncbi:major sperm protein [Anaeramoeba flamelloides]|uniref:Major sperm protein n=1 Tax=Anaeramoeba flamelloides TaxID=1746091 RepID=A0ABQ8Y7L3_9EUKA|nr:major sperm protein [Anaeramoeba flamelloides]